jgi:ribosome-associated translation inhibitor RaiA
MTNMKIEFRTCSAGEATRARVMAGLKTVLAALLVEPTVARATFTDENGPKGGPAIRCALEVKQPRRPAVHVEAVATTQWLAFDGALAKLERAMARRRETARDAKRRPKKYFAARRELAAS